MKRTMWVLAALASATVASSAVAEQLLQPSSVRPVAYNHSYFVLQEEEASPSDQPQPPAPMEESAAVPAEAAEADAEARAGADNGKAEQKAAPSGRGPNGYSSSGNLCYTLGNCGGGCDDGGGGCGPWTLFPNDNGLGINIGGWYQGGYHNKGNGLFNNHPGKYNTHQWWLFAEREADGSQGLDVGFRIDAMYGVDAQDTQAYGNPPGTWDFLNGFDHGIYGWALPQAYAELAMGDLSIIGGRFYTITGYEVVQAPGNFFYSHALTYYNSEPFTHTGILAQYDWNENLTLYGGWTLGWDTGFEQLNDGSNFLGGISFDVSDSTNVTYATTIGDMGDWALGGRGDGYTQHVVVDTDLTDNLKWVLVSDWVNLSNGPGPEHNDEYSVASYLIFEINECWSYGSRFEWWKSDSGFDYATVDNIPRALVPFGTHSYYEYTNGINYMPTENLRIRPEIRYDWSPAANYDEFTFGVDFVLTY